MIPVFIICSIARNLTISSVMIFLGLVSTRIVVFDSIKNYLSFWSNFQGAIFQIGGMIGYVLLFSGVALFYNWITGLFKYTRIINFKLNLWIQKNFLKVILFLLALIYIPMTSSLFSAVNCGNVTCPQGTELVIGNEY